MLAEREKRMGNESVTSSTDELNEKSKHNTAQQLLEEIRQAVSEASSRGNKTALIKRLVKRFDFLQ